jgi:hypothetical protein
VPGSSPRLDPRRWLALAALAWVAGAGAAAGADEIDGRIGGVDDEEAAEAPGGAPLSEEAVDDLIGGFEDEEAAEAPGEAPPSDRAIEELIGGFEEEESPAEPEARPEATPPEEPSFWDRWQLGGSAGFQASVNYLSHDALNGTDWTGLSMLRARLGLELDGDLPWDWKLRVDGYGFYDFAYLIDGRDGFTSQVLDQYEWDLLLQDAYVQGSLTDDLDLKIGRQVVNWGRSDSLRVLDVLNPIDNRQPGIGDLEDLRLSVAMLRADYYVDRWSFTGLLIPEIRFSKQPVFGNDFFPSPVPLPPEDRPDDWSGDLEYAFAISGIFQGWDVSFHFARYWEDVVFIDPGSVFQHSHLWMGGAGGNYTIGSWLFKAELAYLDGFGFTDLSDPVDPTVERKSRLDFMGGVEYYGINDWQFSLEIVNRHLFDFEAFMRGAPNFAQRNALETAIRITGNFMNDRLEVTLLGIILGERAQDGSAVRLSANYEIRDALEVEGGILLFQKGNLPTFQHIGRNDRLYLELKYSF